MSCLAGTEPIGRTNDISGLNTLQLKYFYMYDVIMYMAAGMS